MAEALDPGILEAKPDLKLIRMGLKMHFQRRENWKNMKSRVGQVIELKTEKWRKKKNPCPNQALILVKSMKMTSRKTGEREDHRKRTEQ